MRAKSKTMENNKKVASLLLILCLFIGLTQFRKTWAYSSTVAPGQEEGSDSKLSADLHDRIHSLRSSKVKVGKDRVRVIIQLKDKDGSGIDALLNDQSIS